MRRMRYGWVAERDTQFGRGVSCAHLPSVATHPRLNDYEGSGPDRSEIQRFSAMPTITSVVLFGRDAQCPSPPNVTRRSSRSIADDRAGGRTKSAEINARFVAYRDRSKSPKEFPWVSY